MGAILAFLSQSWVGELISWVISWVRGKQQAQTDADSAEKQAIEDHAGDGAQSVEDRDSDDAQNAALDKLEQELDNPTKTSP